MVWISPWLNPKILAALEFPGYHELGPANQPPSMAGCRTDTCTREWKITTTPVGFPWAYLKLHGLQWLNQHAVQGYKENKDKVKKINIQSALILANSQKVYSHTHLSQSSSDRGDTVRSNLVTPPLVKYQRFFPFLPFIGIWLLS